MGSMPACMSPSELPRSMVCAALRAGDGARQREKPRLTVPNGDGAELLIFAPGPHNSPQPSRRSLARPDTRQPWSICRARCTSKVSKPSE